MALDYHLAGGYNVFWFHLSTFVVFLAFLGTIFSLFNTILDKVRPDPRNQYVALFAVAWFGLHPAIAETINNVIERSDVYSTFGVVAGILLYARLPRLRKFGLYLVPVFLGVLSKAPALIFPALLFAYVWLFEEDARKSRLGAAIVRCVPAFAACALMVWLQLAMTSKSFSPAAGVSAREYILIQPFVWLRYFISFLLPVRLSVNTELEGGVGPLGGLNVETIAGFLFFAALIAVVIFTARRERLRPISFGFAWFAIALLPTSLFPLGEIENGHRLFFAFVGLVLAVTWALALALEAYRTRGASRSALRGIVATGILALCWYAYGTHVRNEVWRSDESLWYDAIQKNPHISRNFLIYGISEMEKGNYAVAMDSFRRAAAIDPDDWAVESNLGIASGEIGQPVEAERHLERSIALAPTNAEAYFYYARWLDQIGRTREALAQLRTAERLDPSYAAARDLATRIAAEPAGVAEEAQRRAGAAYWIDLSLARYRAGQFDESIAAARDAIAIDPKSAVAYNNVAAAESALGRWDAAIAAARQAVGLDPTSRLAKNNLAWALQQKKRAAR